MFPVYLPLGPLSVHPHPVFESLGYIAGFQLYRWLRGRQGDPIPAATRASVIVAAALGGLAGSRLLSWLDDPYAGSNARAGWLGGKSIVGGLLGGWVFVEVIKRLHAERRSTGDLFALPLCLGIAVGRIGCFLSGLDDRTYGRATALPWGVDFGDGVRRHPTQLYEILALGVIALLVARVARSARARDGDRFRVFLASYLAFRLGIEFLKPPTHAWLGLNPIQWACLAGIAWYAAEMVARTRPHASDRSQARAEVGSTTGALDG